MDGNQQKDMVIVPKRGGGGLIKPLTTDELLGKLNEYFDKAKEENRPLNAVDLAFSLGLTLDDLKEMKGIYPTPDNRELVKRSLLLCEADATQRLIEGKPPIGLIFYLKNVFGWKDKREEERTFNVKIERVRYNRKKKK